MCGKTISRFNYRDIPGVRERNNPDINWVPALAVQTRCHRLNCDHNQGGVMGSVLMCIFSVD